MRNFNTAREHAVAAASGAGPRYRDAFEFFHGRRRTIRERIAAFFARFQSSAIIGVSPIRE